MHELSIVQDLFKLCETNCLKYNSQKITRVEVQIGKLSGVEPHYFQSTFDTFKEGTICSDAKLIIDYQDVMVNCENCGYNGTIAADEFLCPNCSSNALIVEAGEDLVLKRLELEIDDKALSLNENNFQQIE